jgi:FkbM family methyltransferase
MTVDYLHKLRTLADLVARGDWREASRRWRQFGNLQRARKSKGLPFVYNDLGFPAVCHPDWRDSLDEFLDLRADHAELELASVWLEPGDSCLDVGANLGQYTFCFAEKVGTAGEVLSVDADSFIVSKLSEAVALLDSTNFHLVRAAISDRVGEVQFFVKPDQCSTFDQSLAPPDELASGHIAVTVPSLTIAEIVARLRAPHRLSLAKIDIEGAEALALGAAPVDLFRSNGPLWQVEIHAGALARFGATPSSVTGCFPAADFECWLMPKHPDAYPVQVIRPRRLTTKEAFEDAVYFNLICVPRGSRWQARRERLTMYLQQLRES